MKKVFLLLITSFFLGSINGQINDLSISSNHTVLCSSSDVNINAAASQVGVDYFWRDNTNNAVLDSASGTGGDLSFNTGILTSAQSYNLYAVSNGAALDFDGTNDRVITPYTLSSTSTLTVEAWVYPRGTSWNRFISSYRGSSNMLAGEFVMDNITSSSNNGRALRVGLASTSSNQQLVEVANVLTLNTWNHIAFTFDNGSVILYVNGIQVHSGTVTFTTIPTSTSNVCFGEDRFVSGTDFFDGKMDEVRIWSTSRTVTEIANNMNNCLTGTEAGLEAYFNFNQGVGDTLTDLVASNDGVLSNMDSSSDWVALDAPITCVPQQTLQMTDIITIDFIDSTETVTATQSNLCLGESTTVTLGNSLIGTNYYLRDNATNTIIDGPISGTGNSLAFNTGNLNATMTYNISANALSSSNDDVLDFDGINDRVTTTYTLSTTNTMTVEAWIYPRATSWNRFVSSYKGYTNMLGGEFVIDNYNAAQTDGTGLRVGLASTSSNQQVMEVSNVLTLNSWNHVAFTFDNGTVKIYVNAVEVHNATLPFTSMPSSNSNVCLGEDRSTTGAEFFDGKMNEVRIWSTSRSVTELADNMNNCLLGTETGLEAYFNFEDGSGTTLTDLVGSNNGTLLNMSASDWLTEGNVACASCSVQMVQTATVNIDSIDNSTSLLIHTVTANQVGATYQWLDCNNGNAIIAGETGQSYEPTADGDYAVEITLNGCVDTSACVNVTGVAITKIETIAASIHPNPTENILNVITTEMIEEAMIYNINGALMKSISGNIRSINVADLAQGMYILKLQSEKGVAQSRFIKK